MRPLNTHKGAYRMAMRMCAVSSRREEGTATAETTTDDTDEGPTARIRVPAIRTRRVAATFKTWCFATQMVIVLRVLATRSVCDACRNEKRE